MRRKLSVRDQPWRFLNRYDDDLREQGYPEWMIEALSRTIVVALQGLEAGQFRSAPNHLGPDQTRSGFTVYELNSDYIIFQYSCNGSEVIVESLLLKQNAMIDEILQRMSA